VLHLLSLGIVDLCAGVSSRLLEELLLYLHLHLRVEVGARSSSQKTEIGNTYVAGAVHDATATDTATVLRAAGIHSKDLCAAVEDELVRFTRDRKVENAEATCESDFVLSRNASESSTDVPVFEIRAVADISQWKLRTKSGGDIDDDSCNAAYVRNDGGISIATTPVSLWDDAASIAEAVLWCIGNATADNTRARAEAGAGTVM